MRVIASQCLLALFFLSALLLETGVVVFTSAKTAKSTPTPSPVVEEVATPAPVVTETPVPQVSNAAGSASSTFTAATTTAPDPIATTGPSPVPIHSAQVNSNTFRVTDNLVCPDVVADRINAVYTKNKKVFVTCMEKSGYQIFPYSGKVPTAQDITLMVQSPECMAVITAVAMADLPACSIGDMPVKAVVETLLKISVDMADGGKAPSAVEFHALMAWRRDVNAAQAVGLPYDSDSELYAIFKKALWRALTSTDVKVLADMTIIYSNASAQTFADTTGSSLAGTAASVKASDASGSSMGVAASVVKPSASETSTQSSPATRPDASSSDLVVRITTLTAMVLAFVQAT